ncbi:MAG: hypothetical protein AAFR11_06575 [Pseudomonadota bacterium]
MTEADAITYGAFGAIIVYLTVKFLGFFIGIFTGGKKQPWINDFEELQMRIAGQEKLFKEMETNILGPDGNLGGDQLRAATINILSNSNARNLEFARERRQQANFAFRVGNGLLISGSVVVFAGVTFMLLSTEPNYIEMMLIPIVGIIQAYLSSTCFSWARQANDRLDLLENAPRPIDDVITLLSTAAQIEDTEARDKMLIETVLPGVLENLRATDSTKDITKILEATPSTPSNIGSISALLQEKVLETLSGRSKTSNDKRVSDTARADQALHDRESFPERRV